jgi:hypothetical protein
VADVAPSRPTRGRRAVMTPPSPPAGSLGASCVLDAPRRWQGGARSRDRWMAADDGPPTRLAHGRTGCWRSPGGVPSSASDGGSGLSCSHGGAPGHRAARGAGSLPGARDDVPRGTRGHDPLGPSEGRAPPRAPPPSNCGPSAHPGSSRAASRHLVRAGLPGHHGRGAPVTPSPSPGIRPPPQERLGREERGEIPRRQRKACRSNGTP